jgi:hypothetical protein
MAAMILSGSGFVLSERRAATCIMTPGWQYPHWGTCSLTQAFFTGWFLERPSMVVIFFR